MGTASLKAVLTSDEERRIEALRDALSGQVFPGSDGTTLYPLRERIGEGGQGWVFRATWNGSVDVVVKVLRPETESRDALARFQREAQVLRTLSQQPRPNPHVVRFFDHAYASVHVASTGDAWTLPFTVMEYVKGITLESALAREAPRGLGLERARRILRHVVLALRDVHAHGVIHRDLKPSNILLETTGSREIAKVTDFGLAKLIDPAIQRTAGLAGATVGYAPPEQFEKGNTRVGPATDVFSLAAIFYEMVTGLPAFPFSEHDHPLIVMHRILLEAPPSLGRKLERLPAELAERPDVVALLDAEIARALSKEPSARHAGAIELHEAVERTLSALAAMPSIPQAPARAGISVSPAVTPQAYKSSAATLPADELADGGYLAAAGPPPRATRPEATSAAPSGADVAWRVVTPASWTTKLDAIAVSPMGDAAVGIGRAGAAAWNGVAWTSITLPRAMEPRAVRAVAWLGRHSVWAGASPIVVAVGPEGATSAWRFERDGVTFHGAYADEEGILLAGERSAPDAPIGVVAEIALGSAGSSPGLVEVPAAGPLRAVARSDRSLVACGDAGALVRIVERAPPSVVRACDASLLAMTTFVGGSAAVVGRGGFAFRIGSSLDFELEPVQTMRDLHAVTRAPDGVAWCGGAERRVLRRDSTGWVRIGADAGTGVVRALCARADRVLAFVDDGTVLEADPR
jgi:serine/threonine-protein kinase